MITTRPRHGTLLFAGACSLVLLVGCSNQPTYPKEHLTESLQQLLIADHLEASIRFLDHTLAVALTYPGALTEADGQIGLGPTFDDASRKVLTSLHRVILSSNADVQFYVLLISDPQVPGAYLTIVRYIDDVRRANANMLDTPEMFARTILELSFAPNSTVSLEQYVPRDIQLGEFLSWQLARRIQRALTTDLQTATPLTVGRCGGEYRNGEFILSLNVAPTANGPLDDETVRKVFETSSKIAAKVLSSYRFESFRDIRLIHPLSGRNLVLPKTSLQIFR